MSFYRGKNAKTTMVEGPCPFLLGTSLAPHFYLSPREKTKLLEPTEVFLSLVKFVYLPKPDTAKHRE